MDLRKDVYFYDALASFPTYGSTECLYVDRTSGIIYSWDGSSYVASGPGPVPTGLTYLGSWNANTNSPAITSSVGNSGDYYIVGTAGSTNINGISDWGVGDWIIFSSTGVWQKIDNSDLVGYTTIKDESTTLPQRTTIAFVGAGVTASDNGSTTVVTIPDYTLSGLGGVPTGRNITINGSTQDLSADRTYTVTDANLSTSDVTTNDVSITKHGFAPKAPNDTAKFLRGDGTWATIPASSGKFGIADTNGEYTYYSTLTLAMAAATSGQTIEQFADYTETGAVTITLKDGVNINGNGHTYTHSYAAGNSNTLQNILGAISCMFMNWKVVRSGRANGTTGDFVFNATVNDSQFFFSGVFMESTYGNSVNLGGTTWLYKPHSGNLYARAYLTAISTAGSIEGFTGQSTSSGKGIWSTGGNVIKCTGISISGSGIAGIGVNSYGYSTSGIALEGTFNNCYGNSVTYRAADGTAYYNCILVSTSGNASTNGQYKNCTIISSSGNAAFPYANPYHDLCYFESSTNIPVGGTYTGYIRNCVISCLWNNAGGHGLNIGNNSIVTNNHVKVSNTSANCLYYGSAISIKWASNVFEGSTTPVNANITQSVINTEDNQGNILL